MSRLLILIAAALSLGLTILGVVADSDARALSGAGMGAIATRADACGLPTAPAGAPAADIATGPAWLLDTSGFPARWHCGVWSPGLGWTHIMADLGIWSAYMAIPLVLAFFVVRGVAPFPGIMWLFVAFIASCGLGHLLEAVIFWEPVYRLAGMWKVVTAAASWATVFALVPVIPRVSRLPGLERDNVRLARKVERHRSRARSLAEANYRLATQTEELERRSAELERAHERLKMFTYVASHDLKAPLRGIASLAQWVREDSGEALDEAGRERLGAIVGRVERMTGLIEGVLDYSRVLQAEPQVRTVDADGIAREAIEHVHPPEGMDVEIRGRLPVLACDPTHLGQIVQNLVANAIDHHDRAEGVVSIEAERIDGAWRFAVTDDGPGVDPGLAEKIFEPFQSVRPRSEHESTGVGLAIVRSLVELHGGRAWLEPVSPRGARVLFTIPDHTNDHLPEGADP